jgi:hypothetical protein
MDILLPSSPPLRSLSIRLADGQLSIPELWMEGMLEAFGDTLMRISFGNCVVGNDNVRRICGKCPQLKILELAIPIKEIVRPLCLPSLSITLILDMCIPSVRSP